MKLCDIAEQYFKALAQKDAWNTVPLEVKDHIAACQECSKRFLRYALSSLAPLSDDQRAYTKNMTEQLDRHFSLLGSNVGCREVAEFLPILLDEKAKIHVPTPVTVHIDSCQQCYKYLVRLSHLNLKPEQLVRLSKFYVNPPTSLVSCEDGGRFIDQVAECNFDKVPLGILEHIYGCPSCRSQVFAARQSIAETICQSGRMNNRPCELVSPSELLDLVFPFGIAGLDLGECIYLNPAIDHVKQCSACLTKLNEMGQVLYSIAEHKESGIETCYEFALKKEDSENNLPDYFSSFANADDVDYCAWPQSSSNDCSQVVRFLPIFAEDKQEEELPSWVVAHVEQCPKCREHIELIHSWGLDQKQRDRLSKFLGLPAYSKSQFCTQVDKNRSVIVESITSLCFDHLDIETLNHIYLCPNCREVVGAAFQKLLSQADSSKGQGGFACIDIKTADLFDYALPYGIDPASDEYVGFRAYLTGHLRGCPRCIERIRQLYLCIIAIVEYGQSRVLKDSSNFEKAMVGNWHVTKARQIAERIDEIDDGQFEELLQHLAMADEDPYGGWGIKVQVADHRKNLVVGMGNDREAFSANSDLCEEAIEYMQDVLYLEAEQLIPRRIRAHINTCDHCSEQLTDIKTFLKEYVFCKGNHVKEHFEFAGQEVDCSCVKEFLPLLADSEQQVAIPTPITVHLSQCRQCATDIKTLRCLNFTSDQLSTLSDFYTESVSIQDHYDHVANMCALPNRDRTIEAFTNMRFSELSLETIKHMCLCQDCRKEIYETRQAIVVSLDESSQVDQSFCSSIKTADLLAYCLPRYFDLAVNWHEELDESVTNHLLQCKACLEKLQLLHEKVFGIAVGTDSDIITYYELGRPSASEKEGFLSLEHLYHDWPISVWARGMVDSDIQRNAELEAEVRQAESDEFEPVSFATKLKERAIALTHLKRITKIAVAAMIPMVFGLFFLFSSSAAKAIDLIEVYEAIAGINNVHIKSFVPDDAEPSVSGSAPGNTEPTQNVYLSSFVPGNAEPMRREWVSRNLNIRIQETREQVVLFDLGNRVRRIRDSATNSIQESSIEGVLLNRLEDYMTGSFGLLPFSDISDIPENSQWHRVDDTDIAAIVPGAEIYDLTWADECYKWRFFLDRATSRPIRVEAYIRGGADDEYALVSIYLVDYPATSDIEGVIQTFFD